jgi:modification methylase
VAIGTISTTKPPKRDVYQRARLFDPASFTHHAKANLNLLQAILDRYSNPGDLVVDPMGGSGSIYIGLLTGRRIVAGDIEAQWAKLLVENQISLARQSIIAFATSSLACRWDAVKLPLASGQADLIITSPPYFDTFSDWDANSQHLVSDDKLNDCGISYGLHPRQLANIHIYEEYLRAMLAVYREARRILRPGGKLILIVKDVIRGGRRLPIVEDNLSVARAAGFQLQERFDVPARRTQFRNIQRVKLGQEGPKCEPVLVLEKWSGPHIKRRLALLELPAPHDGPGWIIASKSFSHAISNNFEVWTRSPDENEFRLTSGENEFHHLVDAAAKRKSISSGDRPTMKARIRREFAFRMVRRLQVKAGLIDIDGNEIAFYGSERFGKYVCRRLETLGCCVTKSLEGLNNGQRLRWLTQQEAGNVHF